MTERDRLLWQAIRRALSMIVAAIDTHLREPARPERQQQR